MFATVRCLRRHAPAAVPGIVFLSGGQDHLAATMHLSAINQVEGPKPWKLSYSYGRALQDEALDAWRGRQENLAAAQQALNHRAECDSAAAGTRPPWKPNRSSHEFAAAGRRPDEHPRLNGENYRGKAAIERTGRHHR
jgi:fructose-bisphosphate aldolase class 1